MNAPEVLVLEFRPKNRSKTPAEGGSLTLPGGTRLHAGTIEEARELLETTSPDVVLVDRVPPKVDEVDLLRTFQNRDRYVPIVVVTDGEGATEVPSFLNRRADHHICRENFEGPDGVNLGELLDGTEDRVDEYLKIFELELLDEANFDPLTKLPDETALRNQLERSLKKDYEGRPPALISIHVDDLDVLDEDLQSELLKWAADLLTVSVRDDDLVVREERTRFFVLTPPGSMPRNLKLAKDIRVELEELNECLPGNPANRPTCRVGLATADSSVRTPEALIREAERATATTGVAPDETVRGSTKLISSYLDRFFHDQPIPG